jgi:uncharacterized protein (TIGR00369 family)
MDSQHRTVRETQVILARIMLPQDANPAGNVHGGTIMKLIDDAAAAVAMRHARCNVVTISIDRLDFHAPVYVGDLLTLRASMNYVGRTSMEVGVRVEAENMRTGMVRHTSSAYLTFVAIDEWERPRSVPELMTETPEEIKRFEEGKLRREDRLKQAKAKKEARK